MDEQLDKLSQHCDKLERRTDELSSQVAALSHSGDGPVEVCSPDEEYNSLLSQNKKLKYRINILKRSIEESSGPAPGPTPPCLPPVPSDHMCAILAYLEQVFQAAVRTAFPTYPKQANCAIQLSKKADYQCNVALGLSKDLKQPPPKVGQAILDAVPASPVIGHLELSGPGFINISLSTEFIRQQVSQLITAGVTPPPVKKRRIAIDFSSPNIAKEMHVGHLRSTIIGESICRLMEFLGHDVLRINHLGDWGTQFGMLIAHLQDTFPNYLQTPPPISDLQAFYKESKKLFDEDEAFKKRAYAAVVKLQSGEEDHIKGWRLICDISLREFDKVYERPDVKLEPYGESFYQSRMESIVKMLDGGGYLVEEDGRKVMYAEGAGIPLTVVKSDGGFTYDTSDMACINYRINELKADWLIYVTDAGQQQHFKSFTACAKRCGIYDTAKTRLDHVVFGVVLGEDKKKFKTRSGDTVKLIDLLDEGLSRVESILKEKGRDEALTLEEFERVKRAVAYGCVKYADLSHDRTRDYVFSFDRMLDFKGNTAAYLLYALTRICSIARTAGVSPDALRAEAAKGPLQLTHDKEWKLARTLLKLPDILVRLANDLYMHPLCEFLYELSTVYSEFYDNCYCVEKDKAGQIVKVHMHRLLLCEATATVFKKAFFLLGIHSLEKM